MKSLQETYAPDSRCFGCGPANDRGLRIRSFVEGDRLVCDWRPSPHHLAFEGILNGGIIGALLDCHCNWTAAYHLMRAQNAEVVPLTVTGEYAIKLVQPTPIDHPVRLIAAPIEVVGRRAVIEAKLESAGQVTATCQGTFIAVREGHPARQGR